jgi:hypothetical protein
MSGDPQVVPPEPSDGTGEDAAQCVPLTEVAELPVAPADPAGEPSPPPPDPVLSEGSDTPYVPAAELSPRIAIPPIVDVDGLEWEAIHHLVNPGAVRARMRATVEAFEAFLDQPGGPGLLFDTDRANPGDRVIQVKDLNPERPLWIIGDLHGDLLALEASLAAIAAATPANDAPRIVFLGDLFDDEGCGLELLLRVFELMLEAPDRICLLLGNHDEALSYDGSRFASSVSPGDFAEFLNANLAHEWIGRAGKLAVRLFAQAPRALFLPDGLLIAHAGFPLSDLHQRLLETCDWNDPACLTDFVWARAHPKARRKMPNRFTRGSQFGYEDFAAFCQLSAKLDRPVTHMVRGHDHVDERFVIYPAYKDHPVLTTVALSRRLPRESFGPKERVPTLARFIEGSLPQVHRLHIPAEVIRSVYPDAAQPEEPAVAPPGATPA